MLESLSGERAKALREMEGRNERRLYINKLPAGTLIRVLTGSGDHYFYEVTDPANCRVDTFRCEERHGRVGYRGERRLSSRIKVGEKILHFTDDGRVCRTTVVLQITILNPTAKAIAS